jgi:ATP-dependent DNA helicase DinG
MIFDMDNRGYVYWGEQRGRGIYLKASPIDVSQHIRQFLFDEVACAIMTSATLTVDGSFGYFRSRVGIQFAEEIRLESHFDYRNQSRLYVPTDLPDPNANGFLESAVEEMIRLLQLTGGRAFLLFTSLKNMDRAYELLNVRINYPLLLQGTSSRRDLLERFRENEESVLLASASFWQGIDVRGPGLSLVVIDKLPFAVPDDPLVSARINTIREEGGNPFAQYQIPAAALSLKQGLGRLIRSAADRGIMAVLDSRLLRRRYGSIFIRSLHGSPVVTNYEQLDSWWKAG